MPTRRSGCSRRLRIDVNTFNNRVEVRTIYPRRTSTRGNSISANVDYVIEVPSGIAVALKSVSGNLTVSNVRGEVRLEAISGDVSITNTPNVAMAKTVSGNVTARDIGSQTALVLSTVSGTVIGTGLKVRSLDAGSVSGDVRLSGLTDRTAGGELGVGQHRIRRAPREGRPLRVHVALGQRPHPAVRQHRVRA